MYPHGRYRPESCMGHEARQCFEEGQLKTAIKTFRSRVQNYREATGMTSVLPLEEKGQMVPYLQSLADCGWPPEYGFGIIQSSEHDMKSLVFAGAALESIAAFAEKTGTKKADTLHIALHYIGKALENAARKSGFNPGQPRVPAGSSDGGEWTDGGGGGSGGSGGERRKPPSDSSRQPSRSVIGGLQGSRPVRTEEPSSSKPIKPLKVRKASRYAKENVVDPSLFRYGNKKCAAHVRAAVEHATGETMKRPESRQAKDYGDGLVGIGFKPAATISKGKGYPPHGSYTPEEGDVIVIQDTSKSEDGHMAIYTGKDGKGQEVWVSDFIQERGPYPGKSYRDEKPSYIIYRHQNKE